MSIFTSLQLKLSFNVLIWSIYLSIMETTRWYLSYDMLCWHANDVMFGGYTPILGRKRFAFHWIPFSGFREEVKMSQPIRGHLVFPISPKNTNLVEDIDFWVENVSANQRPWRLSCFSDQPEKQKFGIGMFAVTSQLWLVGREATTVTRSWPGKSVVFTRVSPLPELIFSLFIQI